MDRRWHHLPGPIAVPKAPTLGLTSVLTAGFDLGGSWACTFWASYGQDPTRPVVSVRTYHHGPGEGDLEFAAFYAADVLVSDLFESAAPLKRGMSSIAVRLPGVSTVTLSAAIIKGVPVMDIGLSADDGIHVAVLDDIEDLTLDLQETSLALAEKPPVGRVHR